MKKAIKKTTITSILASVLFVVLGAILLISKSADIDTISSFAGIVIIIVGFLTILKYLDIRKYVITASYELVLAIAALILGLITLSSSNNPVGGIGIFLILSGAMKISSVIILKEAKQEAWLVCLCTSLMVMAIGIISLINPFSDYLSITKVAGAMLLMYGSLEISFILLINKHLDEFLNKNAKKN